MPLTNNINAYRDIAETLSALKEHSGGLVRCADYPAAVRWRARAYKYRVLLLEEGPTPYDQMHLSINENVVLVRFIDQPIIEDIEGNVVEVEDEMEKEAKRLARELGLDND